jgi:hypothetical protein
MSKRNYFNKGTLRGTVTRNEMVEMKDKETGSVKGKFLSLEVDCGGNNKVQTTVFNSQANPNKAQELSDQFPVGAKVEVSGNTQEREYKTDSGKTGVNRGVSGMSVRPLPAEGKINATFLLQGDVLKILEREDGGIIAVEVDNSYTDKRTQKKVERKDVFTLTLDKVVYEQAENLEVHKGCNAKFKGKIITAVEFDDYGDIIGNISMLKLDKIEEVVPKSELEDAPDFL